MRQCPETVMVAVPLTSVCSTPRRTPRISRVARGGDRPGQLDEPDVVVGVGPGRLQ